MTNRNEFSQQDWGLEKMDACRGAGQTTSVLTMMEKYMWLPDIHKVDFGSGQITARTKEHHGCQVCSVL